MNLIKKATVVSAIGIASIAGYEGLRTQAYLDPVGIPTICYGYTENVVLGMTKTVSECVFMLEEEIKKYTKQVLKYTKVPLTQGELDAYVSFTYNLGVGAYQRSTLLKKLNAGDRVGACNELLRWVYAGNKILPGLVARRKAERVSCLRDLNEYNNKVNYYSSGSYTVSWLSHL